MIRTILLAAMVTVGLSSVGSFAGEQNQSTAATTSTAPDAAVSTPAPTSYPAGCPRGGHSKEAKTS